MSFPRKASVSLQPRSGRTFYFAQRPFRLACLGGALAALLGCAGEISGPGAAKPGTASGNTPGKPNANGTGGSGSGAPTGAGTVTPPPPVTVNNALDEDPVKTCGAGPIVPGGSYLRRLTNAEFLASARDLLNIPEAELATVRLLSEGTSNNAAALRVSASHAGLYYDAAEQVANLALSTPERRASLVSCELAGSDACLRQLIDRVVWRGFRQNILQEQKDGLFTLSRAAVNAQDPDAYKAAKLVIEGVLNSPHFLYKKDTTNDLPAAPVPSSAWKQLSSYSVLERMSYFILGSLPDEAMMQQALTEQYDLPGKVSALAQQMLADPRAKGGIYRFVEDWLNLPKVLAVPRDKMRYPEWNETLAQAMRTETNRYLEDFYWTENADFLGLFTAPHSYIDDSLAPIYGLNAQGGMNKVSFAANQPRGGLLTQPSVLALTVVGSEVVAPILRGKYVRDTFLCSAPPLPPPGLTIPQPSTDMGVSVRKRLDQHRTDPACKSCHEQLDPVGYGLEQYDLIGRFQPKGFEQETLIGKGQLSGLLGDPEFVGAKQLGQLLHDSNATSACIVKHLQSFAFAREIAQIEPCTVAEGFTAFKTNSYDIKDLMVSIVSSDSFRHITPGAL